MLPSSATAQEAQPGALLLKETDRVLEGNIVRRGDFFEVEIASQSRVSIPAVKVAHFGSTVEDLYVFKKQSISQWSVGDHYQLTRWCLLNNLLDHAADHYMEVAQRAADHPRVKQLAVELEKRLVQEPDFREFLGLASNTPVPAALPAKPNTETSDVVTASSHAYNTARHPEIARRFSDRVQPILMNRCSQAACHGVQSANQLKLMEPYAKNYAHITSDNLASVLGHVSANPNELSPLIRFATRPHGIQRAAAIELTETGLLNELQSWIAFTQNPVVPAVANHQTAGQVATSGGQKPFVPFQPAVALIPVQTGTSQLRQVPRAGPPGALPDPSPTGFQGEQPPSLQEIDALDAQLRQLLGEGPATGRPGVPNSSDPFDPAEFNRKSRP
jgi:hypothetical protein